MVVDGFWHENKFHPLFYHLKERVLETEDANTQWMGVLNTYAIARLLGFQFHVLTSQYPVEQLHPRSTSLAHSTTSNNHTRPDIL
ncbi:hypothetical protein HanIR_Chr04g0151751 [Helianthus annuus]|nr:hypothetical protein HanIR_Chr04g0151751 [Helianthus annuus]